jgi:CBS domain-containing protein
MGTTNIAAADAGPLARDVMLAEPKTFPPTMTVAEARAVFESPRQKLLLVCDGARYVGAVRRDGLEGADDADTIDRHVDPAVPTLAPEDGRDDVPEIVGRTALSRIPVVDASGELLGLVCFNPRRDTYCVA